MVTKTNLHVAEKSKTLAFFSLDDVWNFFTHLISSVSFFLYDFEYKCVFFPTHFPPH